VQAFRLALFSWQHNRDLPMKIRKLKRSSLRKSAAGQPSPRVKTLLDKASSCVQSGQLAQAQDICREILRISPRTGAAHNILGVIYQEQGMLEDAIASLQKAIELDPANANAFFNLGTLLGQQGKYEKATSALRRGLSFAPGNAKAHNNLGLALLRLGRLADAITALQKATELEPRYGDAWFNLGDAYYCSGLLQEAAAAFRSCIRLVPQHAEAQFNLSIALHDMKQMDDAVESLQRTIELAPANEAARHMLAALTGKTPDSAPSQFVTNLFDQYSGHFEQDLINRLEYRIPSLLRQLLGQCLPKDHRFSRVVDLGCGTGLSGQAFHDMAHHLIGIDISAKMLQMARDKDIYHDLIHGDVCEELQLLPGLYDLFIATDVMVYIGNLAPLFKAVALKAGPEAFFVFSVESVAGRDFILQPTGRYGHASPYIARLAASCGFQVLTREEAPIRKEGDAWIPGEIFILKNNPA
jgi:predicted TPR repeat methyltransferase